MKVVLTTSLFLMTGCGSINIDAYQEASSLEEVEEAEAETAEEEDGDKEVVLSDEDKKILNDEGFKSLEDPGPAEKAGPAEADPTTEETPDQDGAAVLRLQYGETLSVQEFISIDSLAVHRGRVWFTGILRAYNTLGLGWLDENGKVQYLKFETVGLPWSTLAANTPDYYDLVLYKSDSSEIFEVDPDTLKVTYRLKGTCDTSKSFMYYSEDSWNFLGDNHLRKCFTDDGQEMGSPVPLTGKVFRKLEITDSKVHAAYFDGEDFWSTYRNMGKLQLIRTSKDFSDQDFYSLARYDGEWAKWEEDRSRSPLVASDGETVYLGSCPNVGCTITPVTFGGSK